MERIPLKPHTRLDFSGFSCEICREVGRGSSYLVYEATYPDGLFPGQEHQVLIKELFPAHPGISRAGDGSLSISGDPETQSFFAQQYRDFERGNRLQLRLFPSHPTFMGPNLGSFAYNHTFYTVLGDPAGKTIQTARAEGLPKLSEMLGWMFGTLEALRVLHEAGYLHLDVSPDNLLLSGKGYWQRVYLLDFNSAQPIGAVRDGTRKRGYSAPELELGRTSMVGIPTDLYSAAAVFYFCLMGTPLIPGNRLSAILPELRSRYGTTVAHEIFRILEKGLHTLPSKRYAGTEEMLNAFQALEHCAKEMPL